MKIYNRTKFSEEEIDKLPIIKCGKNIWRARYIVLTQHPESPDRVISIGTTVDNSMRVIADESKEDWRRELNCSGDFETE